MPEPEDSSAASGATERSAAPDGATPRSLTAAEARDWLAKHPVIVILSVATTCLALGGGAVAYFANNLATLTEAAHRQEIKKLEYEKLRATPLSPPQQPGAADAIERWLKSPEPRERRNAIRIIGANKRE